MFSKRIKLIASLLDKEDKVLDVGTDHALLPIYLIKNNLVELADGSDVSKKVLDGAYVNVKKFNYEDVINLYLSDGLKSIDDMSKYNTLVIAGMGFMTIKSILDSDKIKFISKLIVQTNNDYELFRRYINSIDYKINKEICLKDKGINYIIFDIKKGKQELSDIEYSCGIYNKDNIWYYEDMEKKLNEIINNIPKDHKEKCEDICLLKNNYLNYISREKIEEKNN